MRRFMLVLVGLVAALPVAVAAGGSQDLGNRLAEPVTLVSASARIYSFAQDDGTLAWEECCRGETRSTIKVRAAGGGQTAIVSRPDGGDGAYEMVQFALGGRRVVWGGFVDCCSNGYGRFETAAPGSKPKQVTSLDLELWAWGEYPTGAAGDGETLAYSIAHVWPNDPFGGNTWRVASGGVWRVVGSRSIRIPGTPPTALLGAARGTIVLVPADRRTFKGGHFAAGVRVASNARVEVRDVVSGTLRSSFAPRGRVSAIGMDAGTVAVIVRSGTKARVEWYSTSSGKLLGATSVDRAVTNVVDVSGHTIVFGQGRSILSIDTRKGATQGLARASATPVGLSIEGSRVAWAESGFGRIRAVTVG